jgi:hypothetical protein
MLAGCSGTPGTRIHPIPGGRLSVQQGAGPAAGEDPAGGKRRPDMDVETILAKASESLSVRRAFGTAYEKDGLLIIPVALVAGGGRLGHGTYPER